MNEVVVPRHTAPFMPSSNGVGKVRVDVLGVEGAVGLQLVGRVLVKINMSMTNEAGQIHFDP